MNTTLTLPRQRKRNEPRALAQAGQAAGAALGTGVQTLRETATRYGQQLAEQVSDSDSLAGAAREAGTVAQKRAQQVATEQLKPLADRFELEDRWEAAQDVLGDRLHDARRELAERIEPPKPRRRRTAVLALAVIATAAGVGTAVALSRRPRPAGSHADSSANGSTTSQHRAGSR